jgi:ABC-2 type transport system ATP-binding protein
MVAFYPWMTVRDTLDYLASFRACWNRQIESQLLSQFQLDFTKKVSGLSKGQKVQLALIAAICPEPELLVLDEPTSGLDPIVRREFIETVIGAYQESDPGNRTIFVSTHLISEFEGLIDEFTILDQGQAKLTLEADEARQKYKRIRARFAGEPPMLSFPEIIESHQAARELELVVRENTVPFVERLRAYAPEEVTTEALTLEEVFVAALKGN